LLAGDSSDVGKPDHGFDTERRAYGEHQPTKVACWDAIAQWAQCVLDPTDGPALPKRKLV
jgi:hypothetical protein